MPSPSVYDAVENNNIYSRNGYNFSFKQFALIPHDSCKTFNKMNTYPVDGTEHQSIAIELTHY